MDIKIKENFMFNKEEYDKYNKKEARKYLKRLIINIVITLVSGFIAYLGSFKLDSVVNETLGFIAGISVFVFAISCIFLMYYLSMYGSYYSLKDVFSYSLFAITDDNKLLKVGFVPSYSYMQYLMLNNGLIGRLAQAMLIKNAVIKDQRAIENQDEIDINLIHYCLEISNIYKIENKDDRIEIDCDYVDYKTGEIKKHDKMKIYKSYDYFDSLLLYMQNMSKNDKRDIGESNGKKQLMPMQWKLLKSSHYITLLSLIYLLLGRFAELYLSSMLSIGFLMVIIFYNKKTYRKANDNLKEIVKKRLLVQRMFMYSWLVIAAIIFIVFKIDIQTLIVSIVILLMAYIIAKKIEK